jgi:ATP-dependent exoDNAse (exonuclease V) alpha subunit
MTRAAYARGVAVLAGAAGSGKTRVTGDFVHKVRSRDLDGRLTTTVCAVTHKALSMSRDSLLGRFEDLKVHVDSGTLHFRTIASLLFATAGDLARQSKVLVVEEASMVGAADMAALLDAFEGRAVLLVGDYAQLPSIAWGEAFYGAVRIARRWRGGRGLAELTAVRRSGGGVLRLASAVRAVIDAEGDEERRGRMPAVALALAGGDGVVVAGAETQGGEGSSISTRIARLYMEALRRQAAARGCSLSEAQMHVQVLCPNRDGTNPARPNIDDLNAAVRLELAAKGVIAGPDVKAALEKPDAGDRRAALRRLPPQLGEKVVVADRTDADCALNRNDFGVVFGVDRKKQRYEVEGKAHSATLPASALRPGHAETCHSYQGDEVQEVILAANECSFPCDGRLLYSGLTRAKATLLLPDATVFIALERYCRALWRPSLML